MTVTVETLEKLERTVKMDGFRPGKVPMNVVAQRYGYSVHYEVMNDKVGEAFSQAANEAKLRVAGQPRITEIEKLGAEVTDEAIDRTIEILRKQRRTFAQRAADAPAQEGDRVTVDFEG